MNALKMNVTLTKQFKRETAHLLMAAQQFYASAETSAKVFRLAALSSLRAVIFSLNRYPSPDRSAYSPSRPITVFRRNKGNLADDIGYHREIAIDGGAGRTNWGATYKTTIGLRLCKRHQSSLRQWQYLVWQVASKVTQSVALLAQAQVWSQLKFSALTALVQCLQAPLPACFATTQASTAAVKLDNRALPGRINFGNRCWGYTPAAVF